MLRAIERARRSLNPLGLIEVGHFTAGNPEPFGRSAAVAAVAFELVETPFDCGGDLGTQTGLQEILAADKEELREVPAVRLECDHASVVCRKFRLE
jgi:hypothetical protein